MSADFDSYCRIVAAELGKEGEPLSPVERLIATKFYDMIETTFKAMLKCQSATHNLDAAPQSLQRYINKWRFAEMDRCDIPQQCIDDLFELAEKVAERWVQSIP